MKDEMAKRYEKDPQHELYENDEEAARRDAYILRQTSGELRQLFRADRSVLIGMMAVCSQYPDDEVMGRLWTLYQRVEAVRREHGLDDV